MLQFLPIRNQKRKKEKRYDLLSLSSQVSSRYSKYIRMSCMYVCTSPAHGLFLWLTMAWSKVMMTSTPHVGRRRLRFQWWCGSTYVSTFIKTKRPETWFEKKERKKKKMKTWIDWCDRLSAYSSDEQLQDRWVFLFIFIFTVVYIRMCIVNELMARVMSSSLTSYA